VPYFRIVFTLPYKLSALSLQNKRLLHDLLFRTSAASLLELARDPKHLGPAQGSLPDERSQHACRYWRQRTK
jgi:hypothetical protein